jgi:hypothetical protein
MYPWVYVCVDVNACVRVRVCLYLRVCKCVNVSVASERVCAFIEFVSV